MHCGLKTSKLLLHRIGFTAPPVFAADLLVNFAGKRAAICTLAIALHAVGTAAAEIGRQRAQHTAAKHLWVSVNWILLLKSLESVTIKQNKRLLPQNFSLCETPRSC